MLKRRGAMHLGMGSWQPSTFGHSLFPCFAFGISGSGCVYGSGFWVPGSGFRVPGARFSNRVPGSRFSNRVLGARFSNRVLGARFSNRVLGARFSNLGLKVLEALLVGEQLIFPDGFREVLRPPPSLSQTHKRASVGG